MKDSLVRFAGDDKNLPNNASFHWIGADEDVI
jgi:hypothetical protein